MRFRWSVAAGLLLLAAVILAVTHRADGEKFIALAREAQPAWMLLALAAQAGTYAMEAAVWYAVAAHAGSRPPFAALFRLSIVVLFTNQALPSGGLAGNVFVIHALETRGVDRPTAIAALLVDLVGYYAAYGVSVAVAVTYLRVQHDLHPTVVLTAAILVAVALALSVIALRLPGTARWPVFVHRVPALQRVLSTLADADPALVRRGRLLVMASVFRAGNVALDAFTLWTCLRAVGERASPGTAFSAFMLGSVARTLGIIPGGLGPFEAATIATLTLQQVALEPAVTATLLFRGLSFWIPLVAGFALGSTLRRGP